MKRILSILVVPAVSILIWSCGNNTPKRIVSDVPIKTEILGLKLCDLSSEWAIKNTITKVIDKTVFTECEKEGVGTNIRVYPAHFDIYYGGYSWTYVDVSLNEDKKIVSIAIVASYESVERAKDRFNAVSQTFAQKYGRGNSNEAGDCIFWTDNINAVSLYYEESCARNGNNRSFCTLFYSNGELIKALDKANTPDV